MSQVVTGAARARDGPLPMLLLTLTIVTGIMTPPDRCTPHIKAFPPRSPPGLRHQQAMRMASRAGQPRWTSRAI